MRPYRYTAPVVLAVVLTLACGRSEEDRPARELIREASHLVKMAQNEREVKPREADDLERDALKRLEEAVALYPSAPRTIQLLEDKTRIGPYTLSSLREKIALRDRAAGRPPEEEDDDSARDVLELAAELAGRSGPVYFQAGVLARLAGAYSGRGETLPAEEYFHRARAAAETVETPYFRALVLAELAGQYLLAGREEEGVKILTEARELTGKIEYPFFRSGAAAVLAARFLEAGLEAEASAIIETIEELYFQAWILIKTAERHIEAGRREEARALLASIRRMAERIADPVFQVEIMVDCAGSLAALEEPAAFDLLAEVYALALTVDDPAARVGSLARIASWYAVLGRRERAVEILDRATADAETVENNLFQNLVFLEIVECFAAMEGYDRALDITSRIKDSRFQALGLAALSRASEAAGEPGRAVELAARARAAARPIQNPHFRADILIRLADCLSPPLPVPRFLKDQTLGSDLY